jgi:hypothetical protein
MNDSFSRIYQCNIQNKTRYIDFWNKMWFYLLFYFNISFSLIGAEIMIFAHTVLNDGLKQLVFVFFVTKSSSKLNISQWINIVTPTYIISSATEKLCKYYFLHTYIVTHSILMLFKDISVLIVNMRRKVQIMLWYLYLYNWTHFFLKYSIQLKFAYTLKLNRYV